VKVGDIEFVTARLSYMYLLAHLSTSDCHCFPIDWNQRLDAIDEGFTAVEAQMQTAYWTPSARRRRYGWSHY
jgi:hypothetical protein